MLSSLSLFAVPFMSQALASYPLDIQFQPALPAGTVVTESVNGRAKESQAIPFSVPELHGVTSGDRIQYFCGNHPGVCHIPGDNTQLNIFTPPAGSGEATVSTLPVVVSVALASDGTYNVTNVTHTQQICNTITGVCKDA